MISRKIKKQNQEKEQVIRQEDDVEQELQELQEQEIDQQSDISEQEQETQLPEENEILSGRKFEEMDLQEKTIRALRDILGYQFMTKIQDRSIDYILKGRDLVGAAKTGSGKTLAFLVPALEILDRTRFSQKDGTGIIIISPVRELAQQIFDVLQLLTKFTNRTSSLIIGGSNKKTEAIKLTKGTNIIVATPGRLLDHLLNTETLDVSKLKMLIIDEADQILQQGFEQEINQILKLIPQERQTMLFSATQTKKVEDLVRLAMKDPVFIGLEDSMKTISTLDQGFVFCNPENRFRLLFTFLKKNQDKKIMVFFSSCNSVKFHSDLLNYVDLKVLDIHGKQKQQKRINTFYEFNNLSKGVLLCTDVAARGLDIPNVDWIVQYDPPENVREYIHRVGRTARGQGKVGKALLIILPQEKKFLAYLNQAEVKLLEYEFPESKLADIQGPMENLIEKNYFLYQAARDAYRSYLHSYLSHQLKDVFDVKELDLQKVSLGFGLKIPPKVELDISL